MNLLPEFHIVGSSVSTDQIDNWYVDNNMIKKIQSFGMLPEGWDFGKGKPSPDNIIQTAIQLYRIGSSLGFEGDAFPGDDGGIIIGFYFEDQAIYITIKDNQRFNFCQESGIGTNYEIENVIENISYKEISENLKNESKKWSSSVYSIGENMIVMSAGFPVPPLRTVGGFRYSEKIVQGTIVADQFVHT
ncbi:MAG TPA: hypothetical protein VNE41_07090 [Chitinophagaceae bacterium]|nr:hypothetical protein [Chitinophagaceae bacterium]